MPTLMLSAIYKHRTRSGPSHSSFEKLEKGVGVDLDLLGKEKFKNVLNDQGTFCIALQCSIRQ